MIKELRGRISYALSLGKESAPSTFGDGQGRAPLVSQDIQADAAVGIDVWVVDTCCKVYLGRLERVVGWEVDGKEKDTA